MIISWPMLKVNPDKPVEPVLVELLSHVDASVRALNLSYFAGGAFARDLLLTHVHGFSVPRPTRDVDIGIAVRNWDDFEHVKESLMGTGRFAAVSGIAHRLRFTPAPRLRGIPLDILPFSGVEEPGSVLRWPPKRDVQMSVAGFAEALAQAEPVRISSELIIPVASLAGQALLKLAAWLDRRADTSRDAVDLSIIFRRYGDAGNMDRLYDQKPELLTAVDFDVERAGATLLGEDVRAMATSKSYDRLSSAFVSPAVREAFVTHVSSGLLVTADDRVARARTLIDDFFIGFGPARST